MLRNYRSNFVVTFNHAVMKNKTSRALSPYTLFLFRLFAIALAALIITASVNASPKSLIRSVPRENR